MQVGQDCLTYRLLTFYGEQTVDSIVGLHLIYQVEFSYECRTGFSAEGPARL